MAWKWFVVVGLLSCTLPPTGGSVMPDQLVRKAYINKGSSTYCITWIVEHLGDHNVQFGVGDDPACGRCVARLRPFSQRTEGSNFDHLSTSRGVRYVGFYHILMQKSFKLSKKPPLIVPAMVF